MKRREFFEKTLAGGVVVRAGGTRSDGGRLNEQVESSLENLLEPLDGGLFVSSFVHEDGQLDPLRLRFSDRNARLSLHQQTFHFSSA